MNKLLTLIYLMITLTILCSFMSGCNFFGKQGDESKNTPIGQLDNGLSVVGVWSFTSASTSPDNNPKIAITESFEFDVNGGVHYEVRYQHVGGVICSGLGRYQISENNVTVYIQASVPSSCALESVFPLKSVNVNKNYLEYEYTSSSGAKSRLRYFADKKQNDAPLGLWNFNGVGGIDFMILDHHGYFVIQTTIDNEQYFMMGYYTTLNGEFSLYVISKLDPGQVTGDPIVFKKYWSDGQKLNLMYEARDSSDDVLVGTRI